MSDAGKQADGSQPATSGAPKSSKACIFLSWAGEIYGPATPEEVANGIRTSWFEEDALYWHEGLDNWKPVYEFLPPDVQKTDWTIRRADSPASAPKLPAASRQNPSSKHERRRPRKSKQHSRKLDRRGRAIFLGIAVLAVLLTVGILILLMQV